MPLVSGVLILLFAAPVSASVPPISLPGAPLPSPQGFWQNPETVDIAPGNVDGWWPSLAVHPSGDAIVVWVQYGDRMDIWANRYVVGEGWGTPEVIDANAEDARYPDVAMDDAGNAVAVWYQVDREGDVTRIDVWANRYGVGEGWGAAVRIGVDNLGYAMFPSVAVDAAGNAIAVWEQELEQPGGPGDQVWANRYVVGEGWGTPGPIGSDNRYVGSPDIAVDGDGNGIAVWSEWDAPSDSPYADAWYNRYVADDGWQGATLLESYEEGNAAAPRVRSSRSGTALAAWSQQDTVIGTCSCSTLWARLYQPGSGWGAPERISGPLAGFDLAIDDSGSAIAAWSEWLFEGGAETGIAVRARRYQEGVGWGPVTPFEGVYGVSDVSVGMNAAGRGFVLYQEFREIKAIQYVPGTGWTDPQVLQHNQYLWGETDVGVDADGNAFAVWRGGNLEGKAERYDLFASRFADAVVAARPPFVPGEPLADRWRHMGPARGRGLDREGLRVVA